MSARAARLHGSATVALRQGNPAVSLRAREDKTVVLRGLLRTAIDQSGWKHEALAIEMGLPDGPYLSKLLSGEKALGANHLVALPDDVERIFAGLYAETFGCVVVAPVHGDQAVRNLVSGLMGVLAPRIPTIKPHMVKASIDKESR